jgi:hypothetical protein
MGFSGVLQVTPQAPQLPLVLRGTQVATPATVHTVWPAGHLQEKPPVAETSASQVAPTAHLLLQVPQWVVVSTACSQEETAKERMISCLLQMQVLEVNKD